MNVDADLACQQADGTERRPSVTRSGRRHGLPGATSSARVVLGAVVLYAAIDTALVFLRPHLSILYNAESDYGSHGAWSWLMDINFLVRCLLSLAAVSVIMLGVGPARIGARLRFGVGLLVIWALASGLLAFFPDDPVGTPVHGSGRVHLALASVAFVCIALGARVVSRPLRRLPRWQPVGAPLMLLSWGALIPLLLLGHSHFRADSLGGLYEKIFLAAELLWLAVAALPVAFELRPRSRGGSGSG